MQNLQLKRDKYGKIASIVGIICNVFLAGAKIIVGSIFGAISVVADGINNLSDSTSSLISFTSFKLSSKPADKEHPFGHERIEYILSMVVAFFILIMAFELFKESIIKILSNASQEFSLVVILVLALSIIVKLALYFYNKSVAKKINSEILKATAIDCLSDCISTLSIIVALVISKFINYNLDGYAGILVAIIITLAGINVLKSTMSKLIGQAPDQELVDKIKQTILSHKEVYGIHDLNVYCYGPNKYFASVHIEVDADVDVMISHELIDSIEEEFYKNTNIVLTGHLDPIAVNDKEVSSLRDVTTKFVKEINENFSIHDFRIVKGATITNLIFDIAVPYENKLTSEEIKDILSEKLSSLGNFRLVVKVEYQTL